MNADYGKGPLPLFVRAGFEVFFSAIVRECEKNTTPSHDAETASQEMILYEKLHQILLPFVDFEVCMFALASTLSQCIRNTIPGESDEDDKRRQVLLTRWLKLLTNPSPSASTSEPVSMIDSKLLNEIVSLFSPSLQGTAANYARTILDDE